MEINFWTGDAARYVVAVSAFTEVPVITRSRDPIRNRIDSLSNWELTYLLQFGRYLYRLHVQSAISGYLACGKRIFRISTQIGLLPGLARRDTLSSWNVVPCGYKFDSFLRYGWRWLVCWNTLVNTGVLSDVVCLYYWWEFLDWLLVLSVSV